jgi:hypothetical protein
VTVKSISGVVLVFAATVCFAQQSANIPKPSPAVGAEAMVPRASVASISDEGSTKQSEPLHPFVASRAANEVAPNVTFSPVSEATVQDIHLRPLYTTAIRLPSAVTTVAVGAPTLFEAEHKDQEPNLVFVKPSTHEPAQSNLLIAMANGDTVSVRLISPGDAGSSDPVDFVVDYHGKKSLFADAGSNDVVTDVHGTTQGTAPLTGAGALASTVPSLDSLSALSRQTEVASPHWYTAKDLSTMIKANALAPNSIALAIGDIRQQGEDLIISFSVLNISDHWLQIMPPQVDLANPLASKKDKKKNGTFAEPVRVLDYHLENPKLPPGARADGSVTLEKPDSKLARESLLLHIATSASIDRPVYFPLPFVAASEAEIQKENLHASR